MKKYTSEERFDALNRHRGSLSIDRKSCFTDLTQRFECNSIEEMTDIILQYEEFDKIYSYDMINYIDKNSFLYNKSHEEFFNNNRVLSDEEINYCIDCDIKTNNSLKTLTSKERIYIKLGNLLNK